jgi:mannitol/fructose-specific phosphotransferase system IIA component (Ntr-type)
MRLLDVIQGKLVIPRMRSRNKWDAIEELVDKLVEQHEIRFLDRREVLEAVLQRERSRSTGLDRHVALPHGRTRAIEDILGTLGIAPEGLPFESTDGTDARLVCLLVLPELRYRDHIQTLANVARLLSDDALQERLVGAGRLGSAERVVKLIEEAEGPAFLNER